MSAARQLGHGDLDALLALYEHLHRADEPLPERRRVEATWQKLCDSPDHLYLGVEVDALLVASCAVAFVPNLTRGARPYAVIENVVTHGDHRRRGLGSLVLATRSKSRGGGIATR